MSAIIGSILGFSATLAPEAMTMIKDHFAHAREMEVKVAELSAAKEGWEYAAHANSKIADLAAAQQKQLEAMQADGADCKLIQFVKSSVRPILTYSFFVLFAVVKLVSAFHAYHVEHLSTLQALPLLWDDETETLFSAVISFWFGSRAFTKVTNNNDDRKVPNDNDSEETLSGTAHVVGE
jgi:hypothetical protein